MNAHWKLLLGAFLAVSAASLVSARGSRANKTDTEEGRRGKLMSIFNVVRFPNDPCDASGNRNGTCYTADECEDRDGTNSGSCADGYGVCCTFTLGCGDMSKENCTYFEGSGLSGGACRAKICMTNNDICQLRLDFNTFVITGPSTTSVSITKQSFGVAATGGAKSMTTATQCNTDTFSVTNPGGQTPPVICGTNSGEHMYVQASDACNDLIFQMNSPRLVGGTPVGTAAGAAQRMWSIKVSQIACNDVMKAPNGCTQYHYSTDGAGTIQSFNYEGGSHLARQNQNICIRRERGMCRICYSADDVLDVQLSGMAAGGVVKGESCCGYGTDGVMTLGYDCIVIPGGIKNTADVATMRMELSEICGRSLGLVTTSTATVGMTVCTDRVPFHVRFLSDDFEHLTEVTIPMPMPDVGFKIRYWQNNQCF